MTILTEQLCLRLIYLCLGLTQGLLVVMGWRSALVREALLLNTLWLLVALVTTLLMRDVVRDRYGVSLWVMLTARESPHTTTHEKDTT
jgi:hypothetical protein